MKTGLFAYTVFVDIIKASLNGDIKSLKILKHLAYKIVEEFRPNDRDLLEAPVEKMHLHPGTAGLYDHRRDVIIVNLDAETPASEILRHELTHRNIFRKCKETSQKFMYNILLELADNDIEDWMGYYMPVYIIKQIGRIRKIYKI
jgi:hypothetical protein